jgi:hypothetical protein
MSAIWQVRLKSQAGALVALLDDYEQSTLTKIVDGVGTCALRMKGADPKVALLELDGQIEFWRRDEAQGLAWYLEAEYLFRGWNPKLTSEGAYLFEAMGHQYNHLLKRRVVEVTPTTPGVWSGAAETVIKAIVKDQCGADAMAARQLTGLTIAADGARGNAITNDYSSKNLLEVCQGIAAAGGGDFDVVGTGAGTFQFTWYPGQRGTDRSATIKFAPELGDMAEADLQRLRHDEVNTILVGGQNSGTARETVWRTDTTLTDDSPWNRCEAYVSASQETTDAGLNTAGDTELFNGRPTNQFSCVVLQLPGCYYGQHYQWGDLVATSFDTYSGIKQIRTVTITVSANEGESIKLDLVDV